MNRDRLFELTFGQLFLCSLSDYEIHFILDLFCDNPDITPTIFKELLFNENPELYNKLYKLHLID